MVPNDIDTEERDDSCERHVHTYIRETDIADGHQHIVMSVSGPSRGLGPAHIHRLRVRTTFVDEHWHWFDVMSGPALEVPDNNHIHYYAGETTVDDRHRHQVEGVTGVAPVDYDEDEEDDRPPVKSKLKKGSLQRK